MQTGSTIFCQLSWPFKALRVTLCSLIGALLIGCATPPRSGVATNPNANGVADARGIYEEPEVLPEYPGGLGKYVEYLKTSVQYPPKAIADGVQGKVIMRFVIDSTGTVTEPQVKKALRADCDAEALRIVQQMPRWKPGRQKGRVVSTWCNAPVSFVIRP